MNNDNDITSRSWFSVFNNPEQHGYEGMTPEEILKQMAEIWIKARPSGSCALTYCISKDGLRHVHAVFEDIKPMRSSVVRKAFPGMHVEPTKGTKKEAEDYIKKIGKFAEEGEVVICEKYHGEIKGFQGKRNEFDRIRELIDAGYKPDEIFQEDIRFRKYDKLVKDEYYAKKVRGAPLIKDLRVCYHVGLSGSGKSYSQTILKKMHGRDEVYVLTDYQNGGFDKYYGERILFMDEFRAQLKYYELLMLLDVYTNQLHARYSNVYSLWDEVHITSVLPPEKLYEHMVKENANFDSIDQLLRRITSIVYHEKVDGEYLTYTQSMSEYTNYQALIEKAHNSWLESGEANVFIRIL